MLAKPSARTAFWPLLCALGFFSACTPSEVREEWYAGGIRKSQSAYMLLPGDAAVRHGLQLTWYPDGSRESMESYRRGCLQGYSLRWYPDGRMKSAEHYTDGVMDGQARYWGPSGALTACFNEDGGDCLGPGKAPPSRLVSGS